ncbi:MAG: 5'-3' exonuclease H3TH domain-containing protein [Bdellovibrionota bacterium]
MAKKRLFIIDTMALAFRNYHAFGARPLTTSNGLPTSAIFGSALFLLRLIEAEKPDYLLAATDSKESTFRHKLYPQYKANRGEMPEDLALQIPYLFRLFELLGVQMLKQPGVEADDLIGSVVTQFKDVDMEKYIVSGDKDFMQLVDAATFLYAPKKAGEVRIIDNEGVMDKFGCSPHQVIDVLALIGDASDNVPGVKGIGEKGAAKLISTYGSLDAVYDNIDELTNKRQKTGLIENKDMAYLSQELVTIKTDVPLESSLEDYSYDSSKALTNPQLLEFFQELEFKGLSDRAKLLADAANDGSNKSTLSQRKSSSEKNEKKVKKESVKTESKKPEAAGTQNIFASIDVARMKEENKVDYRLANSRKTFEELKECLAACDLFSFDSETTGLNIKSDKPIGLSFSMASGIAWYLPLISKHLDNLSVDEILKEIQPFFIDTKKIKVAHNLKFDLQMLHNIGINIAGPIGDTMIAAFIIDASSRFGIDYCSEKYLNFKNCLQRL